MSTKECQHLYSLLQAFDLTGQRTFQHEWSGHEAFAAPAQDPSEFEHRRKVLEDALARLWRQDQSLRRQIEDEPTQAERALITAESQNVWAERNSLREELNCLPDISDCQYHDFGEWTRRVEIEKLLREGFKSGDLTLRLVAGAHGDYREWLRDKHFRISFAFSIVVPPRSARRRQRRFPAYIAKHELNDWLARFAADAVVPGERTPEDKCRAWLAAIAHEPTNGRLKADFLLEARSLFPDLSKRAFDRAWGSTAPEAWQKPGPKT
ncbi:hypothetical protein [Primorskyibacter marinus]|uniref:hypothetical protein n=1 Tax=Primorskyibacter marinus TaxID=1977320 RepID=UPI000E303569|nr:hypothetical protein [Primorskyibacter marinus]